ncbi:hypothetical protein D3C85_1044400 [compost metagenome]
MGAELLVVIAAQTELPVLAPVLSQVLGEPALVQARILVERRGAADFVLLPVVAQGQHMAFGERQVVQPGS